MSTAVCVRTFSHPPGLSTTALKMLREELEHSLQAPSDDITGISGTRSASEQLKPFNNLSTYINTEHS